MHRHRRREADWQREQERAQAALPGQTSSVSVAHAIANSLVSRSTPRLSSSTPPRRHPRGLPERTRGISCPLPNQDPRAPRSFVSTLAHLLISLVNRDRPENIPPIDRTQSNKHINLARFTSAAYCPAPSAGNAALGGDSPNESSMVAAINRNKELLREREEKLSAIGDKTQAAADSASDFLKEIRAFNQKQTKKKWYQL